MRRSHLLGFVDLHALSRARKELYCHMIVELVVYSRFGDGCRSARHPKYNYYRSHVSKNHMATFQGAARALKLRSSSRGRHEGECGNLPQNVESFVVCGLVVRVERYTLPSDRLPTLLHNFIHTYIHTAVFLSFFLSRSAGAMVTATGWARYQPWSM